MSNMDLRVQHGAPKSTARAADATALAASERGWAELVRTSAARGGLAMVSCLLLWSILPALLGWSPRLIVTGSMEPRVSVGDVIITRAVPASTLAEGQVVTVKDPDHPNRTRTHRLVGREADGALLIKGDANASADSSRVSVDDVLGVGVIRVPWVGRPARWAAEGNWAALTVTLVVLGWCVISAFPAHRRRTGPEGTGSDDAASHSDAGPDADVGSVRGPAPEVAPEVAPGVAAGVAAGSNAPSSRLRRRGGYVVALVIVAIVAAGAMSSPASAAFVRSATNAGNAWNAAAKFYPYRDAVQADTPYLYWRLGQASGTTVTDTSVNNRAGTLVGSPFAWGQAGALAADALDTSLGLTTARINANTSVAAPPAFSVEAWFRSTSTAGGRILGMGDQTGTADSTQSTIDRQLYLATTGKVMFGMVNGANKTAIASNAVLNDGAWHHVVGTYASKSMKLYVDGVAQSATATVNTPFAFTGYWRAGAETMTGWTDNPTSTYFAGDLQELAVYTTALALAKVQTHRNAGINP